MGEYDRLQVQQQGLSIQSQQLCVMGEVFTLWKSLFGLTTTKLLISGAVKGLE